MSLKSFVEEIINLKESSIVAVVVVDAQTAVFVIIKVDKTYIICVFLFPFIKIEWD